MTILRVFPRRTQATPSDKMVVVGSPGLIIPKAERVMISVTFTWDKPRAEILAEEWSHYLPTQIGGPAYDDPGHEFHTGMFLKQGYVITTRGCPNRCYGCFVPSREGALRELPITNGWDVLDNNLLAASSSHIFKVLRMLKSNHKKSHSLEAWKLLDFQTGLYPK